MPNTNLEVTQKAMEDFKKSRNTCWQRKKKMQLKLMKN